jgi:hypothetical protein
MKEVDRIADQMKRGFDGGAWHGPGLGEVLEGVDATAAAARPVPAARTIWELVLHLIGTQRLLVARLQGINRELSPEEDWPAPPEPTDDAWTSAIRELKDLDRSVREGVAGYPDEKLGAPLVEGGSLAYDNFHGYVQHNLYHAGQIAILKKQLLAT